MKVHPKIWIHPHKDNQEAAGLFVYAVFNHWSEGLYPSRESALDAAIIEYTANKRTGTFNVFTGQLALCHFDRSMLIDANEKEIASLLSTMFRQLAVPAPTCTEQAAAVAAQARLALEQASKRAGYVEIRDVEQSDLVITPALLGIHTDTTEKLLKQLTTQQNKTPADWRVIKIVQDELDIKIAKRAETHQLAISPTLWRGLQNKPPVRHLVASQVIITGTQFTRAEGQALCLPTSKNYALKRGPETNVMYCISCYERFIKLTKRRKNLES